ncbi:unnamed protein product, partial [Prunus brigantina]
SGFKQRRFAVNLFWVGVRCFLPKQKEIFSVMEHKHKFLATASSQAQVPYPESIIDRYGYDEIAFLHLSLWIFEVSIGERVQDFKCPSFLSLVQVVDQDMQQVRKNS